MLRAIDDPAATRFCVGSGQEPTALHQQCPSSLQDGTGKRNSCSSRTKFFTMMNKINDEQNSDDQFKLSLLPPSCSRLLVLSVVPAPILKKNGLKWP
jgi:hypothetical protein